MPHGDVWEAHSWQFGNPNYFISAKAFDLSSPQESMVFFLCKTAAGHPDNLTMGERGSRKLLTANQAGFSLLHS